MRCIAIDDEPLALTQITGYIDKTPFLQLSAACHCAVDSIPILTEETIDLLFIDINMPDINGLDFVRTLRQKPMVIFVTAYSEYALDGFRVDAFDYLLKPIGYLDFLYAAEKAYRQYKLRMNEPTLPAEPTPERFFVKSEYKTMPIEIQSITHIESRSEYLRIYTETTPPVMTLGSMKLIEEKLPSDRFMRVHRSYIVHLSKITSVERNHILINHKIRIPVGEQYKEAFRNYLASHSL
ncbi:MAG: LytTR family DNA-binding domain-containing protein [Tannerellaceae bacterium]|jgi:two-component system LytT family response regulator|nr:LytTR family DNA-binding domain-containing protein [Tannerellaceae bacterium]